MLCVMYCVVCCDVVRLLLCVVLRAVCVVCCVRCVTWLVGCVFGMYVYRSVFGVCDVSWFVGVCCLLIVVCRLLCVVCWFM